MWSLMDRDASENTEIVVVHIHLQQAFFVLKPIGQIPLLQHAKQLAGPR